MDLSPAAAAVLAALLTGALSVVVQIVTNRHARRMAADDRTAALATDRERRLFEARERRYEDRRDAVTALYQVAEQKVRNSIDFDDREGPPGPLGVDVDLMSDLFAARARAILLATPEVGTAAISMAEGVMEVFHHGRNGLHAYSAARQTYLSACQVMLGESDLAAPTTE
jgi:hypothetical protein